MESPPKGPWEGRESVCMGLRVPLSPPDTLSKGIVPWPEGRQPPPGQGHRDTDALRPKGSIQARLPSYQEGEGMGRR